MSRTTREIGFMSSGGTVPAGGKPRTAVGAVLTLEQKIANAEKSADDWEKKHPDAADSLARESGKAQIKAAKSETTEPATDDPSKSPAESEEAAETTPAPEGDEQDEEAGAEDGAAEQPEGGTTPEQTLEQKQAAFDALAKELGYRVDQSGHVAAEERYKFREEKRAFRESRTKFEQEANAFVRQHQPIVESFRLFEAGDIDGGLKMLSKHVLGRELGVSELNEEAVAAASGADWATRKRLQQIERERAIEREERERERAELHAARERESQAAYVRGVSQELGASKDATIAALAEDEEFVNAVVQEQIRHWDPDERTSIPAEEAAAEIVKRFRARHEKRAKAFGAPASPTTPSSGTGTRKAEQQPEGKPPTGKPVQPAKGKRDTTPASKQSARDYFVRMAQQGVMAGYPDAPERPRKTA